MKAALKIRKLFLLVLLLSTYAALFTAQLSFDYDISSLEHRSNLELFQNSNPAIIHSTVSSSKHHASKVNIRLNKRFQRENIEFTYQNKFGNLIVVSDNAFNYCNYNEALQQVIISLYSTRGPPAA